MIEGDTEIFDFNLYYSENQNENEIRGLQLFMQEIELLVKMNSGIWGNTYYMDLEKFVFNKYISPEHIRQDIVSAVSKHCSQSLVYSFKVEIQLLQLEDNKDMLYISFTVFDTDSDRSFLQKFTIAP